MTTAAVAPPSESRVKKCHGFNRSVSLDLVTAVIWAFPARPDGPLIEAAELIVEAGIQRRIPPCTIGIGLHSKGRLTPRPAQGNDGDAERAGRPGKIGHEPGETVEALVDRRSQRFL